LVEHKVELSEDQSRLQDKLIEALKSKLFSPPDREELDSMGKVGPVLKLLHQQGVIVQTDGLFFAQEAVDEAVAHLRRHFLADNQLTLAQFRDYLGTSRKYALPLLEYLDGAGFTRRRGDMRISGPNLRG